MKFIKLLAFLLLKKLNIKINNRIAENAPINTPCRFDLLKLLSWTRIMQIATRSTMIIVLILLFCLCIKDINDWVLPKISTYKHMYTITFIKIALKLCSCTTVNDIIPAIHIPQALILMYFDAFV